MNPTEYINDNNHVIEKADEITGLLADRREFKTKVIGADPTADIAVVKIDAQGFPNIPWGETEPPADNSSRDSPAVLRNPLSSMRVRPNPTLYQRGGKQQPRIKLNNAGISFCFVRSPETPKIVLPHGFGATLFLRRDIRDDGFLHRVPPL